MKINNETKIGIMVAALLAILAVLTVKTGNFNFANDGYTIKVHFNNVDGVNLNSPVMFNGYEVGIVDDVAIHDGPDQTKIELSLRIDNGVHLREGSKAYVKNLGFMGEKYVGLTSGDVGAPLIAPGSLIIGQEPPNFDQLLNDGQEIATRLKSIAQNIDERLEVNKDELDDTMVNLSAVMKDLASLVKNVNERLSTNEKKIDDTIGNLHDLSVNLEELSYDLKLNPWKIMYRGKEKEKEKDE